MPTYLPTVKSLGHVTTNKHFLKMAKADAI